MSHRSLPSLHPYNPGPIFDEILVEMAQLRRKRRFTVRDRVNLQEKIASANRHGMSNADGERLLAHLEHLTKAVYGSKRRRAVVRKRRRIGYRTKR